MFVQRSFDDWIPLMVLFHEHFKRAEGHTKHLCKLHRVNSMLFGVEHPRFGFLEILKLTDSTFVTSYTVVLNITLQKLVFHISFRELLPIVVNLLIDHLVSFFKDLSYL